MKKIFFFLSFIMISIQVVAQSSESEKLKKELNNHPRQDTFRVNRLNELATNTLLSSEEREKFASEALKISNNINYTKGKGYALVLLASVKFVEGKPAESKPLFLQADSIANKTGDLELKANVLWRMGYITGDANQKMDLFLSADSIAKKLGNFELQANILSGMAQATAEAKQKMYLFLRADSLAQKSGNLELQLLIPWQLAYTLSFTDSKKALFYYLKAERIAKRLGNKILLSSLESYIGNFYQSNLSDYAKAMEYSLAALKSAEEANDTLSLINSWVNLGTIYSDVGEQNNALLYYLKAEKANEKLGNKQLESSIQGDIGERYRLMGKYPEAIKAYNKSIELDSTQISVVGIESNLADVYTSMDKLPLAFRYAFSALKNAKELKYESVYGWIYGILSRAYLKKNLADSAIYYGKLGMAASKASSTIEFMRDNALALSNAYAFKKDFEKAYINRLLYINYRDSMVNTDIRNQTAVQQYNFNLDKKEAEINILHEQKKGQRNLLIGSIILLSLIVAIASLLLFNNRQKQKANKLLQKQKKEIDEKAQNVELLSETGRKITASLSVENIIGTVYSNVNALMDANVFGIGIYKDELKRLEFPATYENGEALPFYSNNINDENRFGAVCFKNNKEIIINNLDEEYKDHIQHVTTPQQGNQPASVIFLPLVAKGEKLGVITVQSFQKNAYSDYHLYMLRNIATYAAIAIENAESYETLNDTFSTLKSTQAQLIQSEKMASLGELTAGIAHEIQNPLNFVNNFSEVNDELIVELKEVLSKTNGERNAVLEEEILNNLQQNTIKILHHGKRADSIVKGMLQHSRSSSGIKEPTNINALADEYLRLSYHGLRARDKSFNADFKTDFDESLSADKSGVGKINIIPQDIGRVFLNLFNNAFQATMEKSKIAGKNYAPQILVSTKKIKDLHDNYQVEIRVKDNGNGIPEKLIHKIFQPFFTTKPTGQGTGLGLSLSYDIIKAHGGEIDVETVEGEGAEFIIHLPV